MTPRELIALADGIRESSESWADLLRSCKRRGMRAPVCRALRAVFPQTGEQHRIHLRTNPIESAQARWHAVNAPHVVALVRAGARFEKGKLVERPDESGGDQQAA